MFEFNNLFISDIFFLNVITYTYFRGWKLIFLESLDFIFLGNFEKHRDEKRKSNIKVSINTRLQSKKINRELDCMQFLLRRSIDSSKFWIDEILI